MNPYGICLTCKGDHPPDEPCPAPAAAEPAGDGALADTITSWQTEPWRGFAPPRVRAFVDDLIAALAAERAGREKAERERDAMSSLADARHVTIMEQRTLIAAKDDALREAEPTLVEAALRELPPDERE